MKKHALSLLVLLFIHAGVQAQSNEKQQNNGTLPGIDEVSKRISDLEKEQKKLIDQQEKAKKKALESIKKAETTSQSLTELTRKRTANPEDKNLDKEAKKLENELKRLNKQTERNDAAAKKIEESLKITEQKIAEENNRLTGLKGQGNEGSFAGQDASRAVANSNAKQQSSIAPPPPPVERKDIAPPPPPVERQDAASPSAQAHNSNVEKNEYDALTKVLEQSYTKVPNSSGQPPIIINNIILPSNGSTGYQVAPQQAPNRQNARRGGQFMDERTFSDRNNRESDRERSDFDSEEWEEFQAYRAWKANRGHNNYGNDRRYRNDFDTESDKRYNRNNFDKEGNSRFERRFVDDDSPRNQFSKEKRHQAGVWLVPMVGLHASNFEANIKDDEASGQAGWNAGLDFRVHTNRFFVQPGVHYFSSSVDIISKDSLSNDSFKSGPRIHSLKVPLLIGVYLTKAKQSFFKFNVKGGVVGNYLIDVDKNAIPGMNKNNLEKYSYGINGGVGLEFGPLVIDISHEWGISNMFKTGDTKNNILRATVGLRL